MHTYTQTDRQTDRQTDIHIHTHSLFLHTVLQVQWNLFIKDTLNKGHLSNEDTVCSPNHIELCTKLPLN